MLDIQKIRYMCLFLTPEGTSLELTNALISLSWQESIEELAMKAQATFINCQLSNGQLLHSIVRPGGKICIFSDYGEGPQEVFRGTIWNWDYSSEKEKLLKITAYDDLIYLQKSKDNRYFPAGQQTKNIVESIAAAWKIPLRYQWQSITHGKLLYKSKTVGEMIFDVLNEAKSVLGQHYAFLNKGGTFYVLPWGSNEKVYTLSAQDFVLSTQNQISLDRLTTKVLITGKGIGEGRPPILATVEGQTKYGTLQEIVPFTRGSSMSELKKKGEAILREQGQPSEIITITAPDIPLLRKGDQLEVAAGNLLDSFYTTGITHDAGAKKMTVTLQRKAG